jgi:hypothetical protein
MVSEPSEENWIRSKPTATKLVPTPINTLTASASDRLVKYCDLGRIVDWLTAPITDETAEHTKLSTTLAN